MVTNIAGSTFTTLEIGYLWPKFSLFTGPTDAFCSMILSNDMALSRALCKVVLWQSVHRGNYGLLKNIFAGNGILGGSIYEPALPLNSEERSTYQFRFAWIMHRNRIPLLQPFLARRIHERIAMRPPLLLAQKCTIRDVATTYFRDK